MQIRTLLKKIDVPSSTRAVKVWNANNTKEYELAKFDVMTTVFKAMETEVLEGRRAEEDLKKIKFELEKM